MGWKWPGFLAFLPPFHLQTGSRGKDPEDHAEHPTSPRRRMRPVTKAFLVGSKKC